MELFFTNENLENTKWQILYFYDPSNHHGNASMIYHCQSWPMSIAFQHKMTISLSTARLSLRIVTSAWFDITMMDEQHDNNSMTTIQMHLPLRSFKALRLMNMPKKPIDI